MSISYKQPTTQLFLLEELDDTSKTTELSESELGALRSVANWVTNFVGMPHENLGRTGPVCPFVPAALARKQLWLSPEKSADRTTPEVVEVIRGYQTLFRDQMPTASDDAIYKSVVVVFTDLPAARAENFFDDVLQDLAVPSYVEHGFVMGGFYPSNEGTAIYNSDFRPFASPVPFLLMRQAVIADWKFFIDDDDWLKLWARRFGESGVQALAAELRRLAWRAPA